MEWLTSEQLQIFGQLALAVILGSVIGIERTLAHRLAGFRTFALVSLGACVFTLISDVAFQMFGAGTAFDPSRIASQIVVGVGFLAGGLIVFSKDQVHGLTTGAGQATDLRGTRSAAACIATSSVVYTRRPDLYTASSP